MSDFSSQMFHGHSESLDQRQRPDTHLDLDAKTRKCHCKYVGTNSTASKLQSFNFVEGQRLASTDRGDSVAGEKTSDELSTVLALGRAGRRRSPRRYPCMLRTVCSNKLVV
jgi:hypothetical protein